MDSSSEDKFAQLPYAVLAASQREDRKTYAQKWFEGLQNGLKNLTQETPHDEVYVASGDFDSSFHVVRTVAHVLEGLTSLDGTLCLVTVDGLGQICFYEQLGKLKSHSVWEQATDDVEAWMSWVAIKPLVDAVWKAHENALLFYAGAMK